MPNARGINITCLKCGSILASDFQCPECAAVYEIIDGIPIFLSEEDKNNELFKRYIRNYDVVMEQKKPGNPKYMRKAGAREMYNIMEKHVDIKKANVLDVGCGRGELLRALGTQAYGVDIVLSLLRRLTSNKNRVFMANAENLPFDEAFDAISATDIMEHVFEPEKFLNSAYKSLKKGGYAFIRVPYDEELLNYRESPFEFTHLHSFDEEKLKALFANSNFKFEKIYYGWFRLINLKIPFLGTFQDNKNKKLREKYKDEKEIPSIKPTNGSTDKSFLYKFAWTITEIHDRILTFVPSRIAQLFYKPLVVIIVGSKQ